MPDHFPPHLPGKWGRGKQRVYFSGFSTQTRGGNGSLKRPERFYDGSLASTLHTSHRENVSYCFLEIPYAKAMTWCLRRGDSLLRSTFSCLIEELGSELWIHETSRRQFFRDYNPFA